MALWKVSHPGTILYIKVTMFVCLFVRPGPETHIPKKTHTFSFQVSRNEGPVCLGTWGRGRGRAGQGRALFSVTLAFTNRPSDDRVQIITVFTNCHWKQWFKPSAPPQFHRVSVIEFQLPCRALQAQVTTSKTWFVDLQATIQLN